MKLMIIHYETLTISKTSIQTQTSSMDHFLSTKRAWSNLTNEIKASLWFTGRTLFYSILHFAAAQSLLSNCKQSPYWILFCQLPIDTPIFQTKNKQLKFSFLIDFPQKYDL